MKAFDSEEVRKMSLADIRVKLPEISAEPLHWEFPDFWVPKSVYMSYQQQWMKGYFFLALLALSLRPLLELTGSIFLNFS